MRSKPAGMKANSASENDEQGEQEVSRKDDLVEELTDDGEGEEEGNSGEGSGDESEGDGGEEEDEDLLLDQFVAAFETRLDGARRVNARGGQAETSGREGPTPAVLASEQVGGLEADADEGFVVLEDGTPLRFRNEEALAASLAKISWAPRTGLPLETTEQDDDDPTSKAGKTDQSRGHQLSSEGEQRRGEMRDGAKKRREKVGARDQREVRLEAGLEKKLVVPPPDPRKEAREARKRAPQTAGAKWFDLPATAITPELKAELRLIKLRGVLDPKRHYKAPDSTKFPKHFQIGTVIAGPSDFYSGRLVRKERQASFGAELLADPALQHYRKRKYMEIQAEKDLGSKKHYKKQKERRKPTWAR